MLRFIVGIACVWQLLEATIMASSPFRCVMYLTGQHHVVPSDTALTADITHVIIAFMRSDVFNVEETPAAFPLFTSVNVTRRQFLPGTKITVAIGGWGDSKGFEDAARSRQSRERWARQVRAMMDQTGADGVDVDWEYPGGNRDDYRLIPNSERDWEIEAYVLLLQALRAAVGPAKILSIAVPGLERDMMAFTASTLPRIVDQVDFINVMTYDMMNRRDKKLTHHSGVSQTRDSLNRYAKRGAPPRLLNIGLGYYAKWFMTRDCDPEQPLGCPTQLLEDPKTGADLGKTGSFSWHDKTPPDLGPSFSRALTQGRHFEDGSYGYWDGEEKRWWSFDTPRVIEQKLAESIALVEALGLRHSPELKQPMVPMPFGGSYTKQKYARQLIDNYRRAGVPPSRVLPQTFEYDVALFWLKAEPEFGANVILLDESGDTPEAYDDAVANLSRYADDGVRIVAPPLHYLVESRNGSIVPSRYAKRANAMGLKVITWSLERSGPLASVRANGDYYYTSIRDLVDGDGDVYELVDVLHKQVGVAGMFSDWAATATFYANCFQIDVE